MFGLLVPCVLKTCFFCVFQIGAANAIKRKAVPVTPEPETDNERPPPGLTLPAAKRQRSTDDPHMLALMSKTDTLSVVLQDMATRNQTPPPAPAYHASTVIELCRSFSEVILVLAPSMPHTTYYTWIKGEIMKYLVDCDLYYKECDNAGAFAPDLVNRPRPPKINATVAPVPNVPQQRMQEQIASRQQMHQFHQPY